ncbi:hypothetical protein SH2C18_12030 [Clostridium sediminicola]|uniref:hypothetical protein n=1 Tax=Clostridium sediminicola TaxID=3114879 RepID=UPI0031F1EC55
MGSNLDKIKELCIELNQNLDILENELGRLESLNDEKQFEKIFSNIDLKEKLLMQLRKLLEIEKSIPEEINNIKIKTLRKAFEVTKKELEFHKSHKKRIKEIILQINKKNKINNGYLEKITNSYFINKKIT